MKSPTVPLRTLKDVRYYEGTGSDPKLNSLDLYLPEGKTNFPLVLFIHGGSYRAGDKAQDMDAFVETFAKLGLPLNIANAHGWEILSPCGFEAVWDGASGVEAVTVRPDDGADHTPFTLAEKPVG